MRRNGSETTKICPMCKSEKLLNEFYSGKYAGGYSAYCKLCTSVVNKKNRNPLLARKHAKQVYDRNPEKYRSKSRAYLANLKKTDPIKLRVKKFFDVKRVGITDDITREYIEQLLRSVHDCQCCGKKLDMEYLPREGRKYRSNMNSPSFDRVNNHKGYTINNIAIICWECNYRKTDLTLECLSMFEKYIRRYGDV